MYLSSYLKVLAFLEIVGPPLIAAGGGRVLDLGSAAYPTGVGYRKAAQAVGLDYTGLDMQPGNNVDFVPKHPLIYDEIPTSSYDLVISGQMFEHNPFFWVTFCEIARILKPGGQSMVIAPSQGAVHRFPYDCWRFYPDSWSALCAMTGMKPVETIFEPKRNESRVRGGPWRDSAIVAAKPHFGSKPEEDGFHRRLSEMTEPFRPVSSVFDVTEANKGQVFARYETHVNAWVAAMARREAAAKLEASSAAASGATPSPGPEARNPSVVV